MTAAPSEHAERRSLPPGWRTVRLGEVGAIGAGITLGKLFLHEETRLVPYLRVANVKDGYLDLADVNQLALPEWEIQKCLLRQGDLLLTEGGDPDKLGRGTVWEGQLPECVHQNHIFRVRFNPTQIEPKFVSFELQSPYGKAYFLKHAKQTTGIATINQRVLANFPLMLPPLAEQCAIVARIERDMAEVARLRAAAERQREAIEGLIVSGMREVFHDASAHDWRRRRLGDVCITVEGQVDPRLPEFCDLPHINGEVIERATGRLLNYRTAQEDKLISGKYLFPAGSVIYSKLRPYLRKVVLVDFRGLCSADAYPLIVTSENLTSEWLKWALLSEDFTSYAIEESLRSRMPKLNREQLMAWKLPLPDKATQVRLSSYLEHQVAVMTTMLRGWQTQNTALTLLPAALLREVFEGEAS